MPRHVAVIPDGNRRFAREERLPSLYASYCRGAQRVWEVLCLLKWPLGPDLGGKTHLAIDRAELCSRWT